jgi:RimJ/RimL family protein N-acetyltransferase
MHAKLRMVEEGRLPETHFADGRFEDEVWMGMTAEEFFARYGHN